MSKKTTIYVTYSFDITYEYDEHLKDIIDRLKKEPILGLTGAGKTKDGEFGGYSCNMKEKSGVISKRD